MTTAAFLDACRQAIGARWILTDANDLAPYLLEQRRSRSGKACAVALPGSTEEVAQLVRLCVEYRVPLVPQGGNTGLVLGSIPDDSGKALVLSLRRLDRIREIDTVNDTLIAEAGCILQHVQQAAADADRLFPLSLAAEGSCTIGGNLSSNAGGTAVLRYGNARELCLGLEVVTAQGEIWNGLRGLRKDNTGYDLRDLYIGAEGTLGIITAAVLKLHPQPRAIQTAFIALPAPQHALQLLSLARQQLAADLTGFELISSFCMQLVQRHFPDMTPPLPLQHAWYVLLELSDHQSEQHATERLQTLLETATDQQLIADAALAMSSSQSTALWQWRERIPLAQAAEGRNIKHDISVPVSRMSTFIQDTGIALQQAAPGTQTVVFGHLGDGNLHYNVMPPGPAADYVHYQATINRIVHDHVHACAGSISAEHGIGALKRAELQRYTSPVELQLMRTIKQALDPLNLMNPGKIL